MYVQFWGFECSEFSTASFYLYESNYLLIMIQFKFIIYNIIVMDPLNFGKCSNME